MKTVLLGNDSSVKVFPQEDTQYVAYLSDFEEKKLDLEIELATQGVTCEILCISKVPEKAKLEITTISHHKVPNTSCITHVYASLQNFASSNYVGKILIDKGADQTTSYLDNKTLIVGQNTKNNSQPILEIEADDVKASHGATTGRIGEPEIFYLMTRGLSREEAESVILEGFYQSIVSRIEDVEIREKISKAVSS